MAENFLANDHLGKQRENYQNPLLQQYHYAFSVIDADPNNLLIVIENDNKIIGSVRWTLDLV